MRIKADVEFVFTPSGVREFSSPLRRKRRDVASGRPSPSSNAATLCGIGGCASAMRVRSLARRYVERVTSVTNGIIMPAQARYRDDAIPRCRN